VPEDKEVFAYLESENKGEMAKTMTIAQLRMAEWLRKEFEGMRDYLIKNQQLKGYRENYITHIRKDFLETWKNDGLWSAIKGAIEQHKIDEASFEILSGETGEIIPFEKWFQFAMKREGVIDPSKNVVRAYLAYKRAFERKVALDGMIPKIMTYVYSITPKKTTERGLEMDRSLKKFVTEWLNTKKGRNVDMLGGAIRQGGVLDSMLLLLRSLTSVIDLGLSIPIGIASNVGEASANFIMLGTDYFKGLWRAGAPLMRTAKGQAILDKYENFIGKTPWQVMSRQSSNIGNKAMGAMFYLFHASQVRANKHYFLGSLTDEEYNSGTVSDERLARMKLEMGRWRVTEGSKSIVGSTSLGRIGTQYKTWGIVMLRTSVSNLKYLVGTRDFNSRQGRETLRQALFLGVIGLLIMLSSDDKDKEDKSFLGVLESKIVRDALSAIQALNPTLYVASPRGLTFLIDLTKSLSQIVSLEEYKTTKRGEYKKGDLKGVNYLERTIVPSTIKQLTQ
jgi:hypothetical protein